MSAMIASPRCRSVCRRRLHDHEAISDSGLGQDITRPNDVALDLSSQVSHLDTKVLLCVAVAAATPHLPEELLMRQRASRLRRQRAQHLPRGPREAHLFAV